MLETMRRVLWRLGTLVAAFIGGVVGFVPVFALGLGVPLYVPGPLALGTSALLAALSAGWVSNIAPPAPQQRTRSRLLAIFAASGCGVILAALVGVAFGFAISWLFPISDPYSGINLALATYGVSFAVLSLTTSFATWRYRSPREGHLGVTGVTALALSVAGLVVLFLLIPVMGSGGARAWPVVVGFGVTLTLAASGVVLVARNLRRVPEGLGQDAALTLTLIGTWTTLIIVAVYLSCSVVTCQP